MVISSKTVPEADPLQTATAAHGASSAWHAGVLQHLHPMSEQNKSTC